VHLPEGILSAPVLIGGAAAAGGGVLWGLRTVRDDRVPVVALLAATFFVASLIHVPVGVGSVHLILNGLAGVLLGWGVFPALAVGLLLQAVLFGHGGLTVLGVNTAVMALPALAVASLLRPLLIRRRWGFAAGFLAGALAAGGSACLMAAALALSGRTWLAPAAAALIVHLPIMAVEGVITGTVVAFLQKVRPEMLDWRTAGAGGGFEVMHENDGQGPAADGGRGAPADGGLRGRP